MRKNRIRKVDFMLKKKIVKIALTYYNDPTMTFTEEFDEIMQKVRSTQFLIISYERKLKALNNNSKANEAEIQRTQRVIDMLKDRASILNHDEREK